MTGGARERVAAICAALPEAEAEDKGRHVRHRVRGRTFAWLLDDHHGDGRLAICVTAGPGGAETLIDGDPGRFSRPSYLGRGGWVAVALDVPEVDRDVVAELATELYRIVAPKRLVQRLPGSA